MTLPEDGCDDATDGGNVFEGGDLPPLEELPTFKTIDFELVRINAWDSMTHDEMESTFDGPKFLMEQLKHELDKKIVSHDYIRVTDITEDHSYNQHVRVFCQPRCPGFIDYFADHICPEPIFVEHLFISYARAIYVGDQDFKTQHELRKYFAKHKRDSPPSAFKFLIPPPSSVSLEQAQKLSKTGAITKEEEE